MTMTLAKTASFYFSPEGGRLVNEVREHAKTEVANKDFMTRAAARFGNVTPSIPMTLQH